MTPEHRLQWLGKHLKEKADEPYCKTPRFQIDDLRMAFEMGITCGRRHAIKDYAAFLRSMFLQDQDSSNNRPRRQDHDD
jgi:hypothetical protein